MGIDVEAIEQRRATAAACDRADLSIEDLWLRYFAAGGAAGLLEVDGYRQQLMSLPRRERDIVAHAVNERLDELGTHPAPYSRALRDAKPVMGPLGALVGLLKGTHLAPPERSAQLVAAAAAALGVRFVIFLVDEDQRELVPISSPGSDQRSPLHIDTTMAGRAYRLGKTVSSAVDQPRLWVPLLAGAERLGVLDVLLADERQLDDAALGEQCRWVALLLAQLIRATGGYGDAFEAVPRPQPRTPAAELIRALSPPLTAATDDFVLAAMIETADPVGGDAFDYSLSETTATFAVFDATGHALDAGLLVAATLVAYRGARRCGRSLSGQAEAIDETITTHFGHDAFVTGILGELDLVTGRMRYLAAGHPHPLVLRDGSILRTLGGCHRLPFGRLAAPSDSLEAEESLQPGDWIVLHTDGVTEARDHDGSLFGHERLVDLLEREADTDLPPAETVRRLVHAVLDHQDGGRQDDVTILAARWNMPPAGLVADVVPAWVQQLLSPTEAHELPPGDPETGATT